MPLPISPYNVRSKLNGVGYDDFTPTEESQCVTMEMPDWQMRAAHWQGLDRSLEPSQSQWEEKITATIQKTQGFETLVFFIGGQQRVTVDSKLFAALTAPFSPKPNSAAEERIALQKAMTLYESLVLPKAFVTIDVGGWAGNTMVSCPELRQQDCYDEQATMLPFLLALKAAGLLSFHNIKGEVMNFNDTHCANELVEITPAPSDPVGHWVIDSWVKKQGEMPIVLPLNEWLQKDWH